MFFFFFFYFFSFHAAFCAMNRLNPSAGRGAPQVCGEAGHVGSDGAVQRGDWPDSGRPARGWAPGQSSATGDSSHWSIYIRDISAQYFPNLSNPFKGPGAQCHTKFETSHRWTYSKTTAISLPTARCDRTSPASTIRQWVHVRRVKFPWWPLFLKNFK